MEWESWPSWKKAIGRGKRHTAELTPDKLIVKEAAVELAAQSSGPGAGLGGGEFGSASPGALGGRLLPPRLSQFGAETVERLKARVAAELTITFASHYTGAVRLAEGLRPEALARFTRRATVEKDLMVPGKD